MTVSQDKTSARLTISAPDERVDWEAGNVTSGEHFSGCPAGPTRLKDLLQFRTLDYSGVRPSPVTGRSQGIPGQGYAPKFYQVNLEKLQFAQVAAKTAFSYTQGSVDQHGSWCLGRFEVPFDDTILDQKNRNFQ
jgi:hypothetical protein